MITTIIVVFIIFLVWYFKKLNDLYNYCSNSYLYDARNKEVKDKNIIPQYHRYHGGYWNINSCEECGLTGMHEDLHTIYPCPDCGGKIKESGVGKWVEIDNQLQWELK